MVTNLAELGLISPEGSLVDLDLTGMNRYLGALFQLRETLKKSEVSVEELKQFDYVLGRVLMVAVERSSIDEVMGRAQYLGWVENGADIFSIFEPHLRFFYESLKLLDTEREKPVPMIGVVGKIASGKGTVAELLAEQYDVLSFPFSDRLRSIALSLGYRPPFTRTQLRTVNDVFKPMFGNQVFVEWTLTQALRQAETLHRPELIVVDGFRSLEEAEFFLSQPDTHLIAVVADDDEDADRRIRYDRQLQRKRGAEDSLTFDKFLEDDRIESEWIQPVIDLAREEGRVIHNSGGLDTFRSEVLRMIGEVVTASDD